MKQYLDLVQHVLDVGTRKENRTGVDTLSTFNYNYEVDLSEGFPLLTTKEISWKNIVIEMLWFLSGQTDISILKHHKCRFWDAWADSVTGKVPSAYGNFWRKFPTHREEHTTRLAGFDNLSDGGVMEPVTYLHTDFNDQIRYVLNELKRNPMSRRLVVSAWAPGNAQTSALPPCHSIFMFNVQNKVISVAGATGYDPRLCLHLTQRSADVALGVPYNIASYALLIHLFSRFTGIKPGIFAHTCVDPHIYTAKPDGSMSEYDHVPGLKEQLTRTPKKLPWLEISSSIQTLEDVEALMDPKLTTDEVMKHFVLEGYEPDPVIKFKVAV
jgi:thymidylate synthase